ncbi:hypothetical protein E1211_02890 [Micromonospora sp. 15K316]|uniref:hypothetical protein n=1 Tax=Micromonospora sp. 15K316 TaxID=2530376 RepID=UPI00104BB53E|nr:hypothetical protein [Micromonospora sp. 15K316]TDC39952.1 hypothetical protein E1211_02890 [Micromonospora sp. 15K316]
MGEVLPMPSLGDLFADTRGEDRSMRVRYHPEREAVVLSLWGGGVCRASFRMPRGDLPRLLSLLTGMASAGAPADAGPPDRTDPRAPVVAGATVPPGDVARHGHATGPAQRGRLPIVPAPRVA